jgi:hypothetical protein
VRLTPKVIIEACSFKLYLINLVSGNIVRQQLKLYGNGLLVCHHLLKACFPIYEFSWNQKQVCLRCGQDPLAVSGHFKVQNWIRQTWQNRVSVFCTFLV